MVVLVLRYLVLIVVITFTDFIVFVKQLTRSGSLSQLDHSLDQSLVRFILAKLRDHVSLLERVTNLSDIDSREVVV